MRKQLLKGAFALSSTSRHHPTIIQLVGDLELPRETTARWGDTVNHLIGAIVLQSKTTHHVTLFCGG
jgi:hypothetical protein